MVALGALTPSEFHSGGGCESRNGVGSGWDEREKPPRLCGYQRDPGLVKTGLLPPSAAISTVAEISLSRSSSGRQVSVWTVAERAQTLAVVR